MTAPRQLTAPAATPLAAWKQGSPEERASRRETVSGSEIAAIMGTSPRDTRQDVLERKLTDGSREKIVNKNSSARAADLQPLMEQEFLARHPQYTAAPTGYWHHTERPWQRVFPHRVLTRDGRRIAATLTFRTTPADLDSKGWGPDGSTTVPADVYDHTQYTLDGLGVDHGYVVALQQGADPATCRIYRIDRDDAHIATLRAASEDFLRELDATRVTQDDDRR
ncbi:hypothetical protein [Streptomyces sp. CC224B]|uniref:hypothetical protein n=1 Tax=Streptomyces sp. CC224B TaxID=3044571 RepID=UPI0024A8E42D|nr:hypothetical protein [Streptomyces sp. CC224B]